MYENQNFVANRQGGPGALIPRMRITFCGLECKSDENPYMRIKILKIEKTTRSGTQVGQNETSVAPREASKSESQKRSETTYTPQKLLAKFHPNVLSFCVDPPDKQRSLKK